MHAARCWWAGVRQLDVTMEEGLTGAAEEGFVLARQGNPKLDQRDFSRWLTVARLLAVAEGSAVVQRAHWERMMKMEAERERRFR